MKNNNLAKEKNNLTSQEAWDNCIKNLPRYNQGLIKKVLQYLIAKGYSKKLYLKISGDTLLTFTKENHETVAEDRIYLYIQNYESPFILGLLEWLFNNNRTMRMYGEWFPTDYLMRYVPKKVARNEYEKIIRKEFNEEDLEKTLDEFMGTMINLGNKELLKEMAQKYVMAKFTVNPERLRTLHDQNAKDTISSCAVCGYNFGKNTEILKFKDLVCPLCEMKYCYGDYRGRFAELREEEYKDWRGLWITNNKKSLDVAQRLMVYSWARLRLIQKYLKVPDSINGIQWFILRCRLKSYKKHLFVWERAVDFLLLLRANKVKIMRIEGYHKDPKDPGKLHKNEQDDNFSQDFSNEEDVQSAFAKAIGFLVDIEFSNKNEKGYDENICFQLIYSTMDEDIRAVEKLEATFKD